MICHLGVTRKDTGFVLHKSVKYVTVNILFMKDKLLLFLFVMFSFPSWVKGSGMPEDYSGFLSDPSFEREDVEQHWENSVDGKGTFSMGDWRLDFDVNSGGYVNLSTNVIVRNPADGFYFVDVWAHYLNAFDLYQVVKGLPAGTYRLSAKLRNTNDVGKLTDQHVYAEVGGVAYDSPAMSAQSVGFEMENWEELTTADFVVESEDTEVRIGIRSTGNGESEAGWFQADDFRLFCVELAEEEPFVELLQNPSFEEWVDGKPVHWVSRTSASKGEILLSFDSRTGDASVNLQGATSNMRLASEEMTLLPGVYTWSVYAKAATEKKGGIRLGYAPVNEDGSMGLYVYSDSVSSITDREWTQSSFVFTLEEATQLNLVVMNPGSIGTDVLLDDASLTTEDGGMGENPVPEVPANESSKDNPYSVAQAISRYHALAVQPDTWVRGYIVGYVDGMSLSESTAIFGAGNVAGVVSNLLVADAADETDYTKCLVVQLPEGEIRDVLNLRDHPENFGGLVVLCGSLETYFGTYGLKAPTEYELTINLIDSEEWGALEKLHTQLVQQGWTSSWDMAAGAQAVGTFEGLTLRDGHVVELDLSDSNLSGEFPWEVFGFPQLERLDLSGNSLSGGVVPPASVSPLVNLHVLDISHNSLSGNVGQLAALFPSLQSLDASCNCFSDVFPPISAGVTELDLGEQSMANVLELDLRDFSAESVMASFPTILLYDHAVQGYHQDIRLLCTTDSGFDFDGEGAGWGIVLEYADGQLSIPYVSAQNEYYGERGGMLYVFDMNKGEYPHVHSLKATLDFGEGDANFDGAVDVTDLQAIILDIFDDYEGLPFNFTAADMVADGVMNVQDVVAEVNLLLSLNQATLTRRAAPLAAGGTSAYLYCQDGTLRLHATESVAAFDVVLEGVSSLEEPDEMKDRGIVYASKETPGGLHVVGYSLDGGSIPAGGAVLGSFKGSQVRVLSAVLSDSKACKLGVALNVQPTAMVDVQAGGPDVETAAGNIVIRTNETLRDVAWTIVTMDGKLAAKGGAAVLEPGSHIIGAGLREMVIVTVKADGVNITKKINP